MKGIPKTSEPGQSTGHRQCLLSHRDTICEPPTGLAAPSQDKTNKQTNRGGRGGARGKDSTEISPTSSQLSLSRAHPEPQNTAQTPSRKQGGRQGPSVP